MKYKPGTHVLFTNPITKEKFNGEVIHMDDSRMKKPACSSDVCIYFPALGWATTYDEDIVDENCEVISK